MQKFPINYIEAGKNHRIRGQNNCIIPDCIIQISQSHKTDFSLKQRKTALREESSLRNIELYKMDFIYSKVQFQYHRFPQKQPDLFSAIQGNKPAFGSLGLCY